MEPEPTQNSFGHTSGTDEHCECLTRSEVYALVREVVNKRKHTGHTRGVCDHMGTQEFQAQIEYIRKNLKGAVIIVGDDRQQNKRLEAHLQRLLNIFNLNDSLEKEYRYCTSVRNGGSNLEHAGRRGQV
ncbi:Late expression factor 11 [Trabala vishnou gigantina nucleopolyhedrovirus]|uniref:Late expression factor 11 n=1 Tax=Trabala vishnou gigantina nucleopolyhedrovirus TaxID=2863583 RepID=UPI002481F0FA|nr:Late expression factor 11 [Trabala vishnou gigantina nucleopolyhedrovirus]QYC92765.1 Late expression factor 11 [Trabala vishnou gigantina nucleopolyhedrovirus]